MRTIAGWGTVLALLFAVAACVVAGSVRASHGIRYGIQDDAWLEFGPGTLGQRLATFKRLGVPLVRFTLHWNEIAPRRPADPTSPRDRAYDWRGPDKVLRGLRRYRLVPVLTLVGTPGWANGGRTPNFAPPHPRDFRRFATAVARRYPWVHYWLIWNEPNKRLWLRPTKAAIYVQHLLNPGYEAIHAVLPHAQVGGGVTAPRGGLGGVAPVVWLHGMAVAHAKLDAYAHHPYPLRPGETPSSGGCKNCPSITMATVPKLLILVRRYFGPKPVWLTEYGYQTKPPDDFLGVSPKRQATMLSLAAMRAWRLARVTMLIQYLYRDEVQLSRFQSGLAGFQKGDRAAEGAGGQHLTHAQAGIRVPAGSLDLVLRIPGPPGVGPAEARFAVIDHKTNWLGAVTQIVGLLLSVLNLDHPRLMP